MERPEDSASESEVISPKHWHHLPYLVLLHVFEYLDFRDLTAAGATCKTWCEASRDEFLWKRLLHKNFNIRSVPLLPGRTYYSEFKRLYDDIPLIETEVLEDHMHPVLHVSFSHNGTYFATCSADGFVFVWNSAFPVTKKYYRDLKQFSWKYAHFSQFNESDTLLLVSGVYFGIPHSTSGEIAVFSLQDGFLLQCRIVNKPDDVFGAWYNDKHLFSGKQHWFDHLVSTSFLWLNKASQESESEHIPVTHCMFKFYNSNASSVRSLVVARCPPGARLPQLESSDCEESSERMSGGREQRESSLAHRELSRLVDRFGLEDPPPIYPSSFSVRCNSEYRNVKSAVNNNESQDLDSEGDLELRCAGHDAEISRERDKAEEVAEESFDDDSADLYEDSFDDNSVHLGQSDKYLIFTTGYKTYVPHQIGFKRIAPFSFPKKIDPGPSLKERLMLHERRKELQRSQSPPPEPNWLDYDSVSDLFDKVDHVIDLNGHIFGMGLSPDHRYLYVNCRSWPQDFEFTNPMEPPPTEQEMDIHVIDLVSLQHVGSMLGANRAYIPNTERFCIFLDVSDEYVASGAEDKHGYVWDRHYGICLAKYPHADVVNAAAFNPTDPSMLVTTSDDSTVKVWRSWARVRELGLNSVTLRRGMRVLTRL